LFEWVALGSHNPPLFVSGKGMHDDPWRLRSFASRMKVDDADAPVIVSMGDDLDSIFQSQPPAPIDIAVVLKNFQRLGVEHAACAAVLAWDEPDVMGLAALDVSMGKFSSLSMTVPVSRGPVADALPAGFRRASLAPQQIRGGVERLPVVNRIPLPGVILGGENCHVGFQRIESEPDEGRGMLFARWDDRIVLSFPLVAAMQKLKIEPKEIEVVLGEYVKLGSSGVILPIDEAGRLDHRIGMVEPLRNVAAADLIDGDEGLLPGEAKGLLVLRDDRSAVDEATRAFSTELTGRIAALSGKNSLSVESRYQRADERQEWILLGVAVLLGGLAATRNGAARRIMFAVLATAVLISQWVGFGVAQLWLPAASMLGALAAACLVSLIGMRKA
jgi:hypothetical protein